MAARNRYLLRTAPDLYSAPPNEYLILPRLTNTGLLKVFYAHVLELARLVQASEVPRDLDPANIARGEDPWRWSVSLPMQVEKLWADLQAVRKQVARALAWNARARYARALAAKDRAERARAGGRQPEYVREEDEWPADVRDEGAQPADKDLLKGCMHLYHIMDAVVLFVTPELAKNFVLRLLEIAKTLPADLADKIPVLSRRPDVAGSISQAWQDGQYPRALAMYFKAQIRDELDALRAIPAARL
jgi:hypothetical protein